MPIAEIDQLSIPAKANLRGSEGGQIIHGGRR